MLEVTTLRQQPEEIARKLAKKHFRNPVAAVQEIVSLDQQRRECIEALEQRRAEMNRVAKTIGAAMAQGKKEEAEDAKGTAALLKEQLPDLEAALSLLEGKIENLLYELPNTPHDSVPEGKTATDNSVVYDNGKATALKAALPTNALPHWELATKYDLINFELGVKITGAGFPVYKGKGARLQRALIHFFLDEATTAGYTEVQPPILVNEASGYGTGQLPDKEGQMYYVTEDKLYLIPTAEVPITNLFRDVILAEKDLPDRYCGYTPCFRREAGSYGKDVRGLNRLHQFDKVEIVQLATPDTSYDILEAMRTYVAGLLDKLELPYRTLLLCSGDMSFASAKTYDMEVYSAGQDRWLEVSSVSNFETFQSNRLKLRYKNADGKTRLAHTLNGSALALPRILAALLENNQQADGSILLPEVLHRYTGFASIN